MTASTASDGNISIPAPLVRIKNLWHTEPSSIVGGPVFDIRQIVEVSAADFTDELLQLDLRIELLRRRKAKVGRHGWQWVHPADHANQMNAVDGGRSRGGNHYDDTGGLMASRVTTVPVINEYVWSTIPLGAWWKMGLMEAYDSLGNPLPQTSIPVSTGSQKGGDTYGHAPSHMPQWTVIGGVTSQRFAFRLSCIDPAGQDSRDRLSGPVSAAKIVMRPVRGGQVPANKGFPVWPDGLGGSISESTNALGMWLEVN